MSNAQVHNRAKCSGSPRRSYGLCLAGHNGFCSNLKEKCQFNMLSVKHSFKL